jgi:hypothetical protein
MIIYNSIVDRQGVIGFIEALPAIFVVAKIKNKKAFPTKKPGKARFDVCNL